MADGDTVLVEVDGPTGAVRAGAADRAAEVATRSLEHALDGVRHAASAAVGKFREMTPVPDEIVVTFGVKLDAQANAMIARTGAQGQFEVRATWRADAAPPAPGHTAATD